MGKWIDLRVSPLTHRIIITVATSKATSHLQELARRQQRLKKIQEAKVALEAREQREHPGETIGPKKQISGRYALRHVVGNRQFRAS